MTSLKKLSILSQCEISFKSESSTWQLIAVNIAHLHISEQRMNKITDLFGLRTVCNINRRLKGSPKFAQLATISQYHKK